VPGRIFTFYPGGPVIMHFPTKRHYADRSKLEDIKVGLVSLATEIKTQKIRSIAIPALGCGLGGLDWSDVKPLIEDALGPLTDVRIIVFEPE
jgi:O-acetyl-ADP-ribose deacetylase (regulator of RNase III)